MKFGKRYTETLASAGFPPEWRQSAIEYRKLKKVINKVAKELQDLGLTSNVLKELLEQEPGAELPSGVTQLARDYSSGEDSPSTPGVNRNGTLKRKNKRPRRSGHASYEVSGNSENPDPIVRIVFDSLSSESDVSSSAASTSSAALFPFPSSDTGEDILEPAAQDDSSRFTEVTSEDEDKSKPSSDTKDDEETSNAPSGSDLDNAPSSSKPFLERMYGYATSSEDDDEEAARPDWSKPVDIETATVLGQPVDLDPPPRKPRRRSATVTQPQPGLRNSETAAGADDDAVDADDESVHRKALVPRNGHRRHHRHRKHRKEVVIHLNSDTEFLTMLAHALTSLAELQNSQKKQFAAAVELLARQVSSVSSPTRPRSDLYIWREIFSLWVEASIFESDRERDRGERSVEEAEEKLKWFVDQVAKRKLAKRMRHKESRSALEKFVQLNTDLLDIKRFQMANEEAARKILKKHDKRTALTAAKGFPKFIAAAVQLSDPTGGALQRVSSPSGSASNNNNGSARVLILPGFPSLPHVLLSTLTQTLLPIIPSIEDYECVICGDVAFKPIRLECGHKFCVRCLVKMQKRGQDACPQCRAPVVLRANASNLDEAMMGYLKLWFPKEVKSKVSQDSKEVAKEEMAALSANDKCVIS